MRLLISTTLNLNCTTIFLLVVRKGDNAIFPFYTFDKELALILTTVCTFARRAPHLIGGVPSFRVETKVNRGNDIPSISLIEIAFRCICRLAKSQQVSTEALTLRYSFSVTQFEGSCIRCASKCAECNVFSESDGNMEL